MAPDPPIAEEIISALIVQMLRLGVIHETDLLTIEGLSEDARHHIEALIVEATAPPASETSRRQLHIVTSDGGKRPRE